MNWTIGFITAGTQDDLLKIGLDSVRREAPDAQLIVVGGFANYGVDIHVPFDESEHAGWITAKKNLIAQYAKHENVCILHDYLALEPGWLKGCDAFGYDWLTCMHRIHNANGARYRDWCVIYNDAWMNPPIDNQKAPSDFPGRMMHYETKGHERWQYYSGSYFCAKKEVLLEVPLDETRFIGQGEDVQHSRLLYQRYGSRVFTMNTMAAARLLKFKRPVPWQNLPCI